MHRSSWGIITPKDVVITLSGIYILYVFASRFNKAGMQKSKIPAATSSTLITDKVLVFIVITSVLFCFQHTAGERRPQSNMCKTFVNNR